MKPDVVTSLKNRIFKTEAGTRLLEEMYL